MWRRYASHTIVLLQSAESNAGQHKQNLDSRSLFMVTRQLGEHILLHNYDAQTRQLIKLITHVV